MSLPLQVTWPVFTPKSFKPRFLLSLKPKHISGVLQSIPWWGWNVSFLSLTGKWNQSGLSCRESFLGSCCVCGVPARSSADTCTQIRWRPLCLGSLRRFPSDTDRSAQRRVGVCLKWGRYVTVRASTERRHRWKLQEVDAGSVCLLFPSSFQNPASECCLSFFRRSWSGRINVYETVLWKQRRQGHPTPVLSPGKSPGRRSLVGCDPWGREESDTTERLHFHFSLSHIGEGNGNPLQCSCLENPRDGGTWWAAVYGVAQSRTRLWQQQQLMKNPSRDKTLGVNASFCILFFLHSQFNTHSEAQHVSYPTPDLHVC